MEVEFEEEVEVGDVEVSCPLCHGEGCLYAKKTTVAWNAEKKENERAVVMEEVKCILCKGNKVITVYVGTTTVCGSTEVDPSDWAQDYD